MVDSGEGFTRDYGCTLAEWERWLPDATQGLPLTRPDGFSAKVTLPQGRLHLTWQPLPPRRIALLSLPRLQVSFVFEAVLEPARREFMRLFDLQTQRGGG